MQATPVLLIDPELLIGESIVHSINTDNAFQATFLHHRSFQSPAIPSEPPSIVIASLYPTTNTPRYAVELCQHMATLPQHKLLLVAYGSMSSNVRVLKAALAAGCVGVVPSGALCPQRLLATLHDVVAGRVAWTVEQMQQAAQPDETLEFSMESLARLTQREREVLEILAQGFSDQEIAERLALSVRTVQGHVSSMLHKLETHSRTELVARYLTS